MSTEAAAAAMGAPAGWAHAIEDACIRWGIQTTEDKAHFLGQLTVETGGFRTFVESMNYSVNGLSMFVRWGRMTQEQAERLGRIDRARAADQPGIANIVYGGEWGRRNLGNTDFGDGWKFRGQGAIQLTGRANYRAFSRAFYGDDRLLDHPDWLQTPRVGAHAAGWYWQQKSVSTHVAHRPVGPETVMMSSRAVNLGNVSAAGTPLHVAERGQQTHRALAIFHAMTQGP